jgi:bifunctional non-homologous end joining protein LigD
VPDEHAADIWTVDGRDVRVTHPEKVYWLEAGYTKGAMLRYYADIAPVLLPYLHDRPVTLRVYPNGAQENSYYQRDRPRWAPAWLRSVPYQPETAPHVIDLPLVDDAAGLLWLANRGCIEFHVWGCRLPDLSVPDIAIFDLDPGDELTFDDVLRSALVLREALERDGVHGYPKTSGGRGLHVWVPLAAGHTFEDVREWVRRVAADLAQARPELFAPVHGSGPTHEGGRITIDAAQNSQGRNTAVPYALRAQGRAPVVSTPLSWEEVAQGGSGRLQPEDFGPHEVLERVRRLGDLFAPVLSDGQRLSA